MGSTQNQVPNINLYKDTEKQEKIKSKPNDSPIAIYEKRRLKNIEEKMAFLKSSNIMEKTANLKSKMPKSTRSKSKISDTSKIIRVMPKRQHKHSLEDFKCDLMCPDCETFFVESTKLKKHIASVHDRVKKRYKCDHCTASYNQKWGLIKHVKITHPNENLSFNKLCQPYRSSENKQGLNAELKKSQKVGIQGIGRKKKCQLVKKNGNLSISEKENETLPFDKLCQPYELSQNTQGLNAELKQAEKYGIQGIDIKKKRQLVKKNKNLSISEKENPNSNLQKLRTNVEIRKDLKNHHDVKCELEEPKTFLKPNKNLVSPNLNLKKWKHDCNQLLNEMVALPISEPFREPVSKIDFPNYYRLFF